MIAISNNKNHMCYEHAYRALRFELNYILYNIGTYIEFTQPNIKRKQFTVPQKPHKL